MTDSAPDPYPGYVPEELAQTISLTSTGEGHDKEWLLTYTPKRGNNGTREKVLVRLSPAALEALYVEMKDLSRQEGGDGTVECDLCGGSVQLEMAVPDEDKRPVHKRCYLDVYDAPTWLREAWVRAY
jgi:hypothetical protein